MDKNQRIAVQIANLIKDLNPNEAYQIFDRARKINTDEYRRESYTQLFQSQIEIARKSGFSSDIIHFLQQQEEAVVENALTMIFEPDETVFVPVIPLSLRSESFQISMVNVNGKFGQKLTQDGVKDLVHLPYIKPYYIFKIGKEIIDTKVPDARRLIEKTGRRPINVAEGIALSLFDKSALLRHNIELALSVSTRDEHSVWSISLRDGKPILGTSLDTSFSKAYGTPSCERTIVSKGDYFAN